MELTLSENKKFLVIDSCTELEYEQLKTSLTKKIEGWRFHPLVKKKVWSGDITFIKGNKIPAGLWKEVIDICKEYDLQFTLNNITDVFDSNITIESFNAWVNDFFAKSDIVPRDYQIDAAFKILRYRRCLAELATSAGKTLISFMVVAYMLEQMNKKKILMIVPNVSLVVQASGDFEQYNKSRVPIRIQQIYAGVKIRQSSNIVIGTYQSLVKYDEEYFEQFDAVFVDECHQAKAASIQSIMDKCWHCDYRFGLSGTVPKRGTVNRLSLMSAMGPLVTQIKANYLQDEGHIAKCKVLQIHMDYATAEQKEAFSYLSKSPQDRQKLFALEQNFINENEKRLDFICNVIKKSTSNSLVLFHKILYGEKIYKKLKDITDKKIYYVDGSINADIREEFKAKMEESNSTQFIIFELDNFTAAVPNYANVKLENGTYKNAADVLIDDEIDEDFLEQYKE